MLWEHCEYNKNLINLFKKYQKKVEDENRAKYDMATQRIVFNTICQIIKRFNIDKFEIFFDDFDQSLKMAIVFDESDLLSHRKEIYDALPQIQDLSIEHEGRDFRWNILSDKNLDKDILAYEFANAFKIVNK